MVETKSKVIHTGNNIVGIVMKTAGDICWIYEHDGGYHTFHRDNLQVITIFGMRDRYITSDRNHADLFINNRPVFTNLKEVVKDRLDKLTEFMA